MTTATRPTAPSAGLGLIDPADMLRKLKREIARLIEAENLHNTEDALHHTLNAATTAILLFDWVWRSGSRDNAALRRDCGLPVPRDTTLRARDEKEEFRKFRRHVVSLHPALNDCLDARDLVQHFELDRPSRNPPIVDVSAAIKFDPEVEARIMADPENSVYLRDGFTVTHTVKWKAKDAATGAVRNDAARDVLSGFVAFWEVFFSKYEIPAT